MADDTQQAPPLMGVLGGLPLGQAPNPTPTAGEATPLLQSAGTSPTDMSAIVAQLIPQIVQGSQQVQQTASQIPTDNIPMPPHGFGYNPKFQPITGQGFGGGVKNLLGDILKGAALIGSSTRPGRGIEEAYYGPGIRQYEAQRQQRASQVEATKAKGALEAQSTGELGQAASAASLAGYRGGMLDVRQQLADTAQQKADQEGTRIASQNAIGLQRIQQGWEKLTQAQQAQKFKQWYQGALIQVANARVAAGMDMNNARIEAAKDIASATAQNRFVTSNPLISQVLAEFGVPTFEQAPGAETTPVTKPNNKGAGKAAPQHKVGDTITQNGHTYTVTSVDGKGNVTGAK